MTASTHPLNIARPQPVLAGRASGPTPMLQFGFICFCIFNLAVYSRFFEWKLSVLHVPLITSSIALLAAAMEGRLLSTFRTTIGLCFAALTIQYAATIPFSSWRTASLETFTSVWLKSVMAFMIAGALAITLKQCRVALACIGFGTGVASLLVLALGRDAIDGRLYMGRGTLGNPNEIAATLLLGLPFLYLTTTGKDTSKILRLIALGMMVTSLVGIVRTGSRTGLLGLAVLVILYFLRMSVFGKVVMSAVVIAGGFLMISAFPTVAARYATLFIGKDALVQAQSEQEARNISSAVGSSEARRALLVNSLKASANHPLLGVGIGAFGAYEGELDLLAGVRPNYQGTHNTYTQVSAEAGLPALILYLAVMLSVLRGLVRVYKRARKSPTATGKQVSNVSFALLASLVAYAFYIFFDFVAYTSTLPVLAGFAVALQEASGAALDNADKERAPGPQQTILLPQWQPRRMPV